MSEEQFLDKLVDYVTGETFTKVFAFTNVGQFIFNGKQVAFERRRRMGMIILHVGAQDYELPLF
jgi:hypothetical protein